MEDLASRPNIRAITDDDKRQKVKDALSTLVLDAGKIQGVIDTFESQIRLANSPDEDLRKKTDLFWENTYVRGLLEGNEDGTYLGMDLGGTNFRIIKVQICNGQAETETKYYNLEKKLLSGPSDGIFDYIATCLKQFLTEAELPSSEQLSLGFTFSFPSFQKSLKVSILKTWTKSIHCPDGPGRDPVVMLEQAIDRQGGLPVPVDIIGRISDTTGTLMAGNFADRNCRIGLILGTGSNAAFVEYTRNIEKWDTCYKDDDDSELVVINCEFGALGDNGCLDFMKTEFDKELDLYSNHPGSYTFEKLYAGHYLGELCRLALVKLTNQGLLFNGQGSDKLRQRWCLTTSHVTSIESDRGDDISNTMTVLKEMDLVSVASQEDIALVREVCSLMSKRGAVIVATAMVVLLDHINLPEVTIGIDGSLYEHHPKYHDHMQAHLDTWAPKTKTKMILVKDGSGQGGAFVAAVDMKKKKFGR